MKIIITESQYKRILREHKEFKDNLFKLLNSGQDENIEMVKYLSEGQGYDLKELLFEYFNIYGSPYFKIMTILDIDKDSQIDIIIMLGLEIIQFGGEVEIHEYNHNENMIYHEFINGDWQKREYDDNGKEIYVKNSDGRWWKQEYDDNGKLLYTEDSNGEWGKYEYDDKGDKIYFEDSDGYWEKNEYDDNGNRVYYEDSHGSWVKYEYDDKGNEIYFEDSSGNIEDNR
jgi:YD repeat-containing protein